MSYIGRGIDQIDNISTLDNLTFNGSDATFNLTQNSVAFVPVSADALQIQIDGVIQSGNYTVSGSTVTFDFTPSGSSVCNGIRHYGVGIITSVSDGAVTTAKLGADSVNGTKIADDSISDEHLDITAITGQTAITSLADTDKFLVSDASDSGNLKYVEKQYLPSGGYSFVSKQTISSSTSTFAFTGLASSNFRFVFDNIKTSESGGVQLRAELRKTSDSSYDTGTIYHTGHQYIRTDASSSGTENTSSSVFLNIGNQNLGNTSGGNMGGWLDFYNFSDSAYTWINYHLSAQRKAGGWYVQVGGGFVDTLTSYDGIKFQLQSGTFETADVTLYQLAES